MEPQLHVLARPQAEGGRAARQLEGVDAGVGGDGGAGEELDGDPSVFLEGDTFGALGGGDFLSSGG